MLFLIKLKGNFAPQSSAGQIFVLFDGCRLFVDKCKWSGVLMETMCTVCWNKVLKGRTMDVKTRPMLFRAHFFTVTFSLCLSSRPEFGHPPPPLILLLYLNQPAVLNCRLSGPHCWHDLLRRAGNLNNAANRPAQIWHTGAARGGGVIQRKEGWKRKTDRRPMAGPETLEFKVVAAQGWVLARFEICWCQEKLQRRETLSA